MSVDVYSAFEIGAMTILGNESRRFVDLSEYQRLEAELAKERGMVARQRQQLEDYALSNIQDRQDLAAAQAKVKELAHQKGALIDRADTYYQKLAAAQEKVRELERRNVGFSELTGLMQTSLEGDTARIGELLDELAFQKNAHEMAQQALLEQGAELAKECEKAETRKLALDAVVSSSCVLGAELAAAQATIVEMREALTEVVDADECQDADGWLCFELSAEAYHRADAALAIPTNQDALHEARAQALEEAVANWSYGLGGHREEIEAKAAAHRAKKGEGK